MSYVDSQATFKTLKHICNREMALRRVLQNDRHMSSIAVQIITSDDKLIFTIPIATYMTRVYQNERDEISLLTISKTRL